MRILVMLQATPRLRDVIKMQLVTKPTLLQVHVSPCAATISAAIVTRGEREHQHEIGAKGTQP